MADFTERIDETSVVHMRHFHQTLFEKDQRRYAAVEAQRLGSLVGGNRRFWFCYGQNVINEVPNVFFLYPFFVAGFYDGSRWHW